MGMLGGLSGPFSRRGPGECGRCLGAVDATWPWAGWNWLRRGFYAGIALLLGLSPFFFADMFVMLPSALVFAFAVGSVNSLARVKPTCLHCGGPVTALRAAVPQPVPS
jgi:hypothetical protein